MTPVQISLRLTFLALSIVGARAFPYEYGDYQAANEGEPISTAITINLTLNDALAEEIANLTEYALDSYNGQSDTRFFYELARIVEAKYEVVAGQIYYIKFDMRPIECKNETLGAEIQSHCQLNKNESNEETCNAKIWERKWEHFRELSQIECAKPTSVTAEVTTTDIIKTADRQVNQ